MYAYRPLADDLRADVVRGVTIYTDRYETSSELLWYGIPSYIIVQRGQLTQWMRWYRPAAVPQHAELDVAGRRIPVRLSETFRRICTPRTPTRVRRAASITGLLASRKGRFT